MTMTEHQPEAPAVPGDLGDQPAAKPECEHFYTYICYRGMSVGICQMCADPDWDDLAAQLASAARGSEIAAEPVCADSPAPAAAERSAASTATAQAISIRIARALYDSIDRCARCKVCEHQCGAAAKVAIEAVSTERARAEAAEGKLAEVRALLEGTRLGAAPHVTPSLSVQRILAIIGSEGEADFARQLATQAKAADAEYKVAEARVTLYEFLHEYGQSELPSFQVAIDLASSLRKIIDDLGSETRERSEEKGPDHGDV